MWTDEGDGKGGENQEGEEMKILNTSKKENNKELQIQSTLYFFWGSWDWLIGGGGPTIGGVGPLWGVPFVSLNKLRCW